MTDYARVKTKLIYSVNSDYSDPEVDSDFGWSSLTPDEFLWRRITVPITTAYTIDLGNYNTITALAIYNSDSSNYIEAEWYYERGTATATDNLAIAQAATGDTITDGDAGAAMVTDGFEVGGYVHISSAEDSANDGFFALRGVAASALTLVVESTMTANADDDSAVLKACRKNKVKIPASGQMLIMDNVMPEGDLVLLANTAACDCIVGIFGT